MSQKDDAILRGTENEADAIVTYVVEYTLSLTSL